MKELIASFLLKLGTEAIKLWLARQAGKMAILKEQAEKNAEKQKEYAKISAEHRTTEQLLSRLRDSSF